MNPQVWRAFNQEMYCIYKEAGVLPEWLMNPTKPIPGTPDFPLRKLVSPIEDRLNHAYVLADVYSKGAGPKVPFTKSNLGDVLRGAAGAVVPITPGAPEDTAHAIRSLITKM